MSGQPGAGDRFLLWFMHNRHTPGRVEQVPVGGTEAEVTSRIPNSLHGFDRSDHKWVAIYLEGRGDAVYNATDSDWEEWQTAIQAAGVKVVELCPDRVARANRS